jgi:hypothetical protein
MDFCDTETLEGLETLAEAAYDIDAEACNAVANVSLFADAALIKRICDRVAFSDRHRLLTWAVSEVTSNLPDAANAIVREACIHATTAVFLGEDITEEEAAALSLAWFFIAGAGDNEACS